MKTNEKGFREFLLAALVSAVFLSGYAIYDYNTSSTNLNALKAQIKLENAKLIGKLKDQIRREKVERLHLVEYIEKNIAFDEFRKSYGPAYLALPCLDDWMPKIRYGLENLPTAFETCKREMQKVFGRRAGTKDPNVLYAAFVAVVTSRLAPYGSSKASTVEKILKSKYLNCSQHSIFMATVLRQHFDENVKIETIGIDGGPIGNHAMVSVKAKEFSIFLDGTASVIALASFDEIVNGKLVSIYKIFDFYGRGGDEAIELTRRTIRGALRMGSIRPEHIIYRKKY